MTRAVSVGERFHVGEQSGFCFKSPILSNIQCNFFGLYEETSFLATLRAPVEEPKHKTQNTHANMHIKAELFGFAC